ncbi:MAG: anti-sigma factor antagonist [Oscillospiraceae bacterium]|nr:anti-sigma factor antagonist [Oscillospiraceae bacterium]
MSAGFVFYKETLTVYIQGELDHHTAKEIRFRIDSEIKRREPRFLELDFSGVTFMDSSGIGLVMGRYKIMSEREGKIVILNPPPPIKKVMMISGIGKLARIINCKEKVIEDGEKIKTEVKKLEACKQGYSKQNENSVSGAVAE